MRPPPRLAHLAAMCLSVAATLLFVLASHSLRVAVGASVGRRLVGELPGASTAALGVGVFVAWLLRTQHPASVRAAARIGAVATLAAATALTSLAWAWSERLPAPHAYVASLPALARLPAVTHLASNARAVAPVAGVFLTRACSFGTCSVSLARAQDDALPPTASLRIRADDELVVRLDARRELLVLESPSRAVAGFDLRTLRPVVLSAARLRPGLAPPPGWRTLALAACLASALALAASRRRERDVPRAATLRDDGAVVLEGRVLTGVTAPPGTSPGAVVVFLAQDLAAQHYRDDVPQRGARVEPGSLDDWRLRACHLEASRSALAWALAACALAPMAAWAANTTNRDAPPAATDPPTRVSHDGLRIEELAPGAGPALDTRREVVVTYTGRLVDGTVFDSTSRHGSPFTFTWGAHQVIPGFERGLEGMRVGGRRRVTIPPELGYGARGTGARGAGSRIPPDATLVFDVTLVALR